MAEAKAQYSAILLGATGNVGGRIVQLLIKNPLCKKVVVVTRRKTDAFADSKVSEVVVNMDRLEDEVAPHAQEVDVALAAFGVGKGSATMPEEEVRKIEIAYPQAGHPWLHHATAALGHAVQVPLDPQERLGARDGGAIGAGVPRDRAGQCSQVGDREDSRVQGDGALLRQGRERRALSGNKLLG
jgi:hypothetical protein